MAITLADHRLHGFGRAYFYRRLALPRALRFSFYDRPRAFLASPARLCTERDRATRHVESKHVAAIQRAARDDYTAII